MVHATAVALDGCGLLLAGPSGAGKSSLALVLMALGARLVADDGTWLTRRGARLWAHPVPATRGLIEARGLGILAAPALAAAPLVAEVDLAQPETRRLPPPRARQRLGLALPLLHPPPGGPASWLPFAAGLIQYLKTGLHPDGSRPPNGERSR